ncbi:hypothetical protein DF268_21480 [Streptomyces sp. V2]|nr:hypothetical protein DF268_21480 [Streptomyces sp. V2]
MISLVLSGTRSWVTVCPVPVIAAGRCAAGLVTVREPRAFLPSTARVSAPAGSVPSRSASPPGQTAFRTRRIVAVLGATRTLNTVASRAPSGARAACGADLAH